MSILLGDLMVSDIIERTGVEISYEDKKWLKERHCHKTELEKNTWHCFALPFLMAIEALQTEAVQDEAFKNKGGEKHDYTY